MAIHATLHIGGKLFIQNVTILNRTVATFTGDARVHMTLVAKEYKVRNAVNANPFQIPTLAVYLGQLLDGRFFRRNANVAKHTLADGWQPRPLFFLSMRVTFSAGHAQ